MTIFLVKGDIVLGFAVAILPILLLFTIYVSSHPYRSLMCIFILNYFLMGIYRYVTIGSLGLIIDALLLLTILSALTHSVFIKDINWKRAKNAGVFLMMIWLLYCIFEIANPTALTEAWIYAIRQAIYPFLIVLFTSVFFYRYRDFKTIVFLWSFFTILAVLKMQWQISVGFDNAEMRFLEEGDRKSLIFLSTGIRYFSFFTDPGNFGSNMGCAMVVFSLCAIYVKDVRLKIYYAVVAFLGMYGMFLSGTRGALAVPFAGYFLYTILTKNMKAFSLSSLIVIGAFLFFTQTFIGQGNEHIRRMRSAFNPNEPSLVVRREHQKQLAVYLKDKPFGEGLGLSGISARRFAPDRLTTNIANDSWYVNIWVQTGIVGLVLYLAIQLFFVAFGVYIILFRIHDKELKGYLSAVLSGLFGMMASSYGNSIFGQYPTAIIMAMVVAFLFLGKEYDQEIKISNIQTLNDGTNKLV
ncbi:MAG: O-antigen ligase family protein [Bacteroidales bacterium]|nr:O-antigen ligase family protein [Bacteroidales bacterium]